MPLKKAVISDPRIQKELNQEFENFCRILLDLIKDSEEEEGSANRLFIGKLIEYIGHSGSSTEVNTHVVKYLLTAFTKVIEMAGDIAGIEKEKKRSQKKTLVNFIYPFRIENTR